MQPFTCLPNQVFPMRKKFSMPRKFSEMGICKLTNFSMVGFGEGGQEGRELHDYVHGSR